jgi:hypothetical protein
MKLKKKIRGMIKMRRRKTYFKRAKAHFSRHKSSYGIIGTVVSAGVYGAFREKLSNWTRTYTSMIPMGNISDEVGLGLLCILGKRYLGNRVPMVKDVFNAGLVIESARIGEAVANGNIGIGMNQGSNSTELYVYG